MIEASLIKAEDISEPLYVDDTFSTYLYTGTGSTQTINNGLDMASGGLTWVKSRTSTNIHYLIDSERPGKFLNTTTANAEGSSTDISLTSSGFSVYGSSWAGSGAPYTSWSFKKSPKFFDVVTYTGDGSSNRSIPHSLGIEPGMITTKSTSTTGDWDTYHRSATGDLKLHRTTAGTAPRAIVTAASDSTFTVSSTANTQGVSYVAYLWAHDASEDGLIQCGSYTGNGSATGPEINLGWEPQYLLIKHVSAGTGNWQILDSMRQMPVGSAEPTLQANRTTAESNVEYVSPTARGFQVTSTSSEVNTSGSTYIYMAIRRSNKPPKSGAEVFRPALKHSDNTSHMFHADWPADFTLLRTRNSGTIAGMQAYARGSGGALQYTGSTGAEGSTTPALFDTNRGFYETDGAADTNTVGHLFRRAPGFFDMVCYTGTGVARTVTHNLGVAPELMIVKMRSGVQQGGWAVYCANIGASSYVLLNSSSTPLQNSTFWNGTQPTNSVLNLGINVNTNMSGSTYIAYLFASLPGINKVGSYSGNGTTQTIDCGFSTGARFVLVKRTDAAGDWYVWDTARGIVADNDPHLSLNTTAAEVTTDDSVDPASVGFVVNQNTATNINVLNGQYIFLSIA